MIMVPKRPNRKIKKHLRIITILCISILTFLKNVTPDSFKSIQLRHGTCRRPLSGHTFQFRNLFPYTSAKFSFESALSVINSFGLFRCIPSQYTRNVLPINCSVCSPSVFIPKLCWSSRHENDGHWWMLHTLTFAGLFFSIHSFSSTVMFWLFTQNTFLRVSPIPHERVH